MWLRMSTPIWPSSSLARVPAATRAAVSRAEARSRTSRASAEAVLEHARQVGVARTGLGEHLGGKAGVGRHLLLPLGPLGVGDLDGDRAIRGSARAGCRRPGSPRRPRSASGGPRPKPSRRRARPRWMSSTVTSRPAGMPSTITTRARPCDSPAVRKRSIAGKSTRGCRRPRPARWDDAGGRTPGQAWPGSGGVEEAWATWPPQRTPIDRAHGQRRGEGDPGLATRRGHRRRRPARRPCRSRTRPGRPRRRGAGSGSRPSTPMAPARRTSPKPMPRGTNHHTAKKRPKATAPAMTEPVRLCQRWSTAEVATSRGTTRASAG